MSDENPEFALNRQQALCSSHVLRENHAHRNFLRWLKFNLVGGIGITVQLGALAFLRSALHLNYLVATVVAVEAAVIHNFFWHKHFTWRDRPAAHSLESMIRLTKFNLSNGAVSLAGNLLVMRLLVGEWRMNYALANMLSIALCSVVNFLLGDHVVFHTRTTTFREFTVPRDRGVTFRR